MSLDALRAQIRQTIATIDLLDAVEANAVTAVLSRTDSSAAVSGSRAGPTTAPLP